ncbi:heavy metal translocating P-type ATPase [Thaumasiovibrio subtropicus]|uniref:heavy metal translocating P-type ATPase n=1 Tax=Thaumasiovibrio subtropicus TaxID=1891207 RepID=UPI001FE8DBCF|nr:heavy metal translocating P-type ATPase [Thaumasiovibrio subtropicus]
MFKNASPRQASCNQEVEAHSSEAACCASTQCSNDNASVTPHNDESVGRLEWHIRGMDCPSCANKVSQAVAGIAGVSQVTVTFSTEKLKLNCRDASAKRAVIEAIEKLGFTLTDVASAASSSYLDSHASRWARPRSHLSFILITFVLVMAFAVNLLLPSLGPYFLATATVVGLSPIAVKAWHLIWRGSPFSIELLMTVAALGALYLGEYVEASMVLWLFLLGEKLEALSSQKARQGIASLVALTPNTATKVMPDGKRVAVDRSVLVVGDEIEVGVGERLGADFMLVSAYGEFDKSALTGESIAVTHYQGETVPAGSLVEGSVVRGKVVSEQGESAIDRIVKLIEDAEQNRAPVERFIVAFSRWYTPAVMLVALLTVVIPVSVFGADFGDWLYRSLTLLLIACPCALVISTPAAMTSALAAAAKKGILIKGGAVIEQLSKSQVIAFDKTGTLTRGEPELTDICATEVDDLSLLSIAAALEVGSHHPLAAAVIRRAEQEGINVLPAESRQALPGHGVAGVIDGVRYYLVKASTSSTAQQLSQQGKTVAALKCDEQILGYLAWQDVLREEAQPAIQSLHAMGLQTVMLTGDNAHSADAIAQVLGVDAKAELLPADKVAQVQRLASTQHVVMVGDGINDAPAMKAASVGIAMASGTDVALEVADAALVQNRLDKLAVLLGLSRKTMAIVRQNVAFALGLKGVFLVTSLFGITGLWLAVIADSGATALVTLNALRLLKRD